MRTRSRFLSRSLQTLGGRMNYSRTVELLEKDGIDVSKLSNDEIDAMIAHLEVELRERNHLKYFDAGLDENGFDGDSQ